MKYEHDDAGAFAEWFMGGATTHLETLKTSLRSQNIPAEDWPDVQARLTAALSEALTAMRQQIRDGTSVSRPSGFVAHDGGAYRLLQQKQQMLENEIGARRQYEKAAARK